MVNWDHVVEANFWCDRNISGEVEMDWQWQKFVKWQQVVWGEECSVENEHKCVFILVVNV